MRVRLALKERVPEPQIDEFAAAWGWAPLPCAGDATERGFEKAWRSTRSAAEIGYIDDPVLGHQLLQVEGEDAEDVAAWVQVLLPVLTLDDLRRAVKEAQDPSTWVPLMNLAGAVARAEYDPEILLVLGTGFAHFDPRVRLAAVSTAADLAWDELTAPLERLAARDPDSDVRDAAAAAIGRRRA